MELSYLISPIAGAGIGYFTNWLAIKMMFRPYEEKKIGAFRLPFTPGLIPKEREKLAKSLGVTIGKNILTQQAIIESLQTPPVKESFEKIFDDGVDKFFHSQQTIGELAARICSKREREVKQMLIKEISSGLQFLCSYSKEKGIMIHFMNSKVEEFLSKPLEILSLEDFKERSEEAIMDIVHWLSSREELKSVLKENLFSFYHKLELDHRRIKELLPDQSQEAFQHMVSEKAPDFVRVLLELAEIPEVAAALTPLVKMAITQMAGKLAAFFIDGDKIYKKLIEGGKEYLEEEKNREEISYFAKMAADRLLENEVAKAAVFGKEFFEMNVDKIVSFLWKDENLSAVLHRIHETFWKKYEEKKSLNIGDVFGKRRSDVEKFMKEWLTEHSDKLVESSVNYMERFLPSWIEQGFEVKICSLPKSFQLFVEQGKDSIMNRGNVLLAKVVPYGLQALDISQVVESQINGLNIEEMEELTVEIAKKELNAITMIGGVLGFIIGCVPMVLRIFGI